MASLEDRPSAANHVLSCLRKMFNMAEVWGYRPDGSNPCRHIQKYPERGSTRLIRDGELRKLFEYLDRADRDGLERGASLAGDCGRVGMVMKATPLCSKDTHAVAARTHLLERLSPVALINHS